MNMTYNNDFIIATKVIGATNFLMLYIKETIIMSDS
jgi:hypothetical protein